MSVGSSVLWWTNVLVIWALSSPSAALPQNLHAIQPCSSKFPRIPADSLIPSRNALTSLSHVSLLYHSSTNHALCLRGGSSATGILQGASMMASNPELAQSVMGSSYFTKARMIGAALVAGGIAFSFLGFMFFFNRTLIGTGNLMMVAGTVLLVGHKRAKSFLFRKERARGTAIFLFGLFLVLRGWARLGVLVQLFGILNLFGNFLPAAVSLVKSIPVVGPAITPILESEVATKAMATVTKMGAKTVSQENLDASMAPPPAPKSNPPPLAHQEEKSFYRQASDWMSTPASPSAGATPSQQPLQSAYEEPDSDWDQPQWGRQRYQSSSNPSNSNWQKSQKEALEQMARDMKDSPSPKLRGSSGRPGGRPQPDSDIPPPPPAYT